MPRQLHLLPLFVVFWPSYSYHVFLIGDSIDRFIVMDWCEKRGDGPNCGGHRCTYWAENCGISASAISRVYRPSMRCNMGNDSLTYLHNYGSRAHGPYMKVQFDELKDPYARTPMRIQHGLDLYFERIGVPDLVMLQTAQWDIQLIYEEKGFVRHASSHGDFDIPFSVLWNSSISRFESDLNDRLTDVQINLARNLRALNLSTDRTNIGLRTAVWDFSGGVHFHGLNDIIREVAWRRNVTLYDLDSDVWGPVDWDYTMEPKLFRDKVHPNSEHLARAGEKISGLLYTSNLIIRGNGSSHLLSKSPQLWLGDGPKPTVRKAVLFVREEIRPQNSTAILSSVHNGGAPLFIHSELNRSMAYKFLYPSTMHRMGTGNPNSHTYYTYENSAGHLVRSGPINTFTRLLLHLSPGDILSVSREQLERIRKAAPPPKALLEAMSTSSTAVSAGAIAAINTTRGKLYLGDQGLLRLAPNEEAMNIRGIPLVNITQGVDDFWTDLLPHGTPVPDIYRDDQLFRLSDSREVFVFKNGSMHSVASGSVFSAHGWSFNSVKVLTDVNDFNVIPRGEPMVS